MVNSYDAVFRLSGCNLLFLLEFFKTAETFAMILCTGVHETLDKCCFSS